MPAFCLPQRDKSQILGLWFNTCTVAKMQRQEDESNTEKSLTQVTILLATASMTWGRNTGFQIGEGVYDLVASNKYRSARKPQTTWRGGWERSAPTTPPLKIQTPNP